MMSPTITRKHPGQNDSGGRIAAGEQRDDGREDQGRDR